MFARTAQMRPGAGHAALLAIKRVFYDVLLTGCRNPLITRSLGRILNSNRQLRAMSLSELGRLTQTVAEIRRLMDAIEPRDPEGAWDGRCTPERATVAMRILRKREAPPDAALGTAFAQLRGDLTNSLPELHVNPHRGGTLPKSA